MFVPDFSQSASFDAIERLSERQKTCLALAADGLTSARIAERLGLSPRTVDEHLLLACRALGVRTRVQAVARCAAAARRRPEPRSFLDPTPQVRGAAPPGRAGRAGRLS
jgi:DNA-binding CsgD family transcriptional regulator